MTKNTYNNPKGLIKRATDRCQKWIFVSRRKIGHGLGNVSWIPEKKNKCSWKFWVQRRKIAKRDLNQQRIRQKGKWLNKWEDKNINLWLLTEDNKQRCDKKDFRVLQTTEDEKWNPQRFREGKIYQASRGNRWRCS